MSVTLQDLIDHAEAKPDHAFPMLSCEACLAADLTGEHCGGHERLVGGRPLPRELGRLTRGMSAEYTEHFILAKLKSEEAATTLALKFNSGAVRGSRLAEALEAIRDGADPKETGRALTRELIGV